MKIIIKIENIARTVFVYVGYIVISTLVFISCDTKDDGNNHYQFSFHQSQLGGGGFVDGIYQIPADSNIVYARSDVGGVYKSSDGGRSWMSINRGLTLGYQHCVASFAINPFNSKEMLRCSGEPRNHKIYGSIHKSIDAGNTWHEVSKAVDFIGNGPLKQFSEKIAYDPFHKGVVYAGGISKGLFISLDNGNKWEYNGFKNEPIVFVAFNPYIENRIYIATADFMPFNGYLTDTSIYKQPDKGKLYLSKDNGLTWQLIQELEGSFFAQLAFTKFSPSTIYAAALYKGVLKSTNEGYDFAEIMNGLPGYQNTRYPSIDTDPNNENVVYTNAQRLPEKYYAKGHNDIPVIPVFKTTDGGKNWSNIKDLKMTDMTLYPGYIKSIDWIGWDIALIKVSLLKPDKLFMSNWYGVSVSSNGGKSWCGNNFKGLENTCIENIVADPLKPGKAYFTLPDHYPLFTQNAGLNYSQFFDTTRYMHSTAIVVSRHNPKIILYGAKDEWNPKSAAIMRSDDGGKSFSVSKQFSDGLTVQSLKEDYFMPGRFYAYIDRALKDGAGLYRSEDYGKSWVRLPLVLPTYIKTLPYRADWIENELLSITLGQVKNVCGTNQLLCVDRHKKNTIYLGEWTEGLFASNDAGETWKAIGKGLPFHKDTTSTLVDIKDDPSNPGVLYAGFVHEGLWKSKDYGKTFSKIFPTDNSIFNASSIVVGGFNDKEIFVACDPLTWSPSPSAIYYSNNAGASWSNIYNGSFGALRWKGIAIDKTSGTLYGVTSGNGAYFISREK